MDQTLQKGSPDSSSDSTGDEVDALGIIKQEPAKGGRLHYDASKQLQRAGNALESATYGPAPRHFAQGIWQAIGLLAVRGVH